MHKSHRALDVAVAKHAKDVGLPPGDRSVLDSLFEQAHRYVFEDNLSVREAGDMLGIPTQVLRQWFRAAGISTAGPAPLESMPKQKATRSIADFLRTRHGSSPISAIHELEQAGHIRARRWSDSRTGPAHQPTFTCAVQVTTAEGSDFSAEGMGTSLQSAKTHAAAHLIDTMIAN
ncbi:hypothetical protein GCM10009745_63330 [Kribbella yunnanensis]|uniref:DRBM domain-containing protein n=2 Tax=Kribbella yunnanensis TaxID=190194 RepID=A0ABN2IKU6_9ACTN